MADHDSLSWLNPKATGDPGRDRNARTLQFSCVLLAGAVSLVIVLSLIGHDVNAAGLLVIAVAGLIAAAAMNRAGRSDWASRTAFLAVLLTAMLLVFQARDGFRSHAMLVFPGLLLITVMMLDRASYAKTAAIVLLAVAGLGLAVKHGYTRATKPVRTSYESIFYVDLNLLVIAIIGSRIARDSQKNVLELRAGIDRLSAANLELAQTKRDLQQSEERLRSAQRLTHVGSWHWDLGVNQIVCSDECKRVFGQPDDYAPTLEGLLQIIEPHDRERVAGEIQRGIEEKNGCSTEFRIVRPDGEHRIVTFTSQVLLDQQGSPQHIFGACQDITISRRLQEEALARHKLETVGTLASGIAHDFNNLLGCMMTQAELAMSMLDEGSRPDDELRAICDVANRGSEIVRQLMIYTGQERENTALVDVAQTIAEMAALLKFSVPQRATLHIDVARDLPPVRASGAQIGQIVMNLVMNASEAIQDGRGEIHVNVRRVTAAEYPADGGDLPAGDFVQVEVVDTGRGMTPEMQARVFDPFFTTKAAGHGLGLAVVSGAVRSVGGVMRLTSEAGRGSTFRVLLPCAGSVATTVPRADDRTGPEGAIGVGTALIVEDEEALRGAAATMLRKSGLSVLEAPDGTVAIEMIRNSRPIDVLLLDVTLPGTPSREVLAEAKRLRPAMRVIVTSAYGEDFAAASLQGTFERFIRKPYSLSDLVGAVRQTLA